MRPPPSLPPLRSFHTRSWQRDDHSAPFLRRPPHSPDGVPKRGPPRARAGTRGRGGGVAGGARGGREGAPRGGRLRRTQAPSAEPRLPRLPAPAGFRLEEGGAAEARAGPAVGPRRGSFSRAPETRGCELLPAGAPRLRRPSAPAPRPRTAPGRASPIAGRPARLPLTKEGK